jgi:hypothetical protein
MLESWRVRRSDSCWVTAAYQPLSGAQLGPFQRLRFMRTPEQCRVQFRWFTDAKFYLILDIQASAEMRGMREVDGG